MELSNGDGGVAKAARTPVTQVRKSSALSSVSPPPHNRTARKTQQNTEVAHRFPYLITTLRKLSLYQVAGTANAAGRRQAKAACSGSYSAGKAAWPTAWSIPGR